MRVLDSVINRDDFCFYHLLRFFLFCIVNFSVVVIFIIEKGCLWQDVGIFVCVYGLQMFVTTAGTHRYFAHKAYKASKALELFYIYYFPACYQGQTLWWVKLHRAHHLHTDTNKDPYNIKRGFLYAHCLWFCTKENVKRHKGLEEVRDWYDNKHLVYQNKYINQLSLFMGYGLPLLLGMLFGCPVRAVIFGACLPIFVSQQSTFFINSLAHVLGQSPHSKKVSAKDNVFCALLTFGEGYHNYHHYRPCDYRNGYKWYHFDPVKWILNILEKLGLCWDLKR